jgi:hypothetical protein
MSGINDAIGAGIGLGVGLAVTGMVLKEARGINRPIRRRTKKKRRK